MNTFYDNLASEYDAAVDLQSREQSARRFIHLLRERYPVDSLLDIACGTGLFALAAAAESVPKVTGIDLSADMLAVARRRVPDAGQARIVFHELSMDDLSAIGDAVFDAAVCMGNSLPHLTAEGQVAQAISEFARVLHAGGVLVLHLLNYARVLDRRERVVGVAREGDIDYIRFYDFPGRLITFNLLRIDWSKTPPATGIDSIELAPVLSTDLSQQLIRSGFKPPKLFGGTDFSRFDPMESGVLMAVAERS
jgi:SAM-dependent methyltransferase